MRYLTIELIDQAIHAKGEGLPAHPLHRPRQDLLTAPTYSYHTVIAPNARLQAADAPNWRASPHH